MKMFRLIVFVALLTVGLPSLCYGQMSDAQVLSYVKQGLAQGRSNEQIGQELVAKGLTQDQAERIKARYESEGNGGDNLSVTEQAVDKGVVRRESRSQTVDRGAGMMDALEQEMAAPSVSDGVNIFGHNIFNSKRLSFEPNENAATPQSYRLGPGDQLIIEIWGYNEATIKQTISPEGRIFISQVGQIQLGGLTIAAASEKIKRLLVSKYAALGGGEAQVSVTLGQVRTIQVNVMGEVTMPGTYRLSSFSTVFNALYRAGGVTARGSMRSIKVVRAGESPAVVDVYGYLFDGKSDSDIALREGDVVIVPPYVRLATVSGSVKRPMTYELVEGETLSMLIDYAGGYTGDAYRDDLRLVRQTGTEREVFTLKGTDTSSWMMEDGDLVTVGSSLDRYANKIEVRGCVFRPGMYQIGGDVATVHQLVAKAGGVMEDAFLPRAIIVRQKEDLTLETVSFDLGGLLSGNVSDILLKKNDIVIVSSLHELEDRGTLTVNGYVASPGTFPFAENTTVEDLILQAGGLLDGASLARVDVARRVSDPTGTHSVDTIGKTFTFAIKDGLAMDGGEKFILEPYDVVSVRKSPSYKEQQYVEIIGEVAFPGSYVLVNDEERISDLIKRAGGLNASAYIRGARLMRVSSEENDYLNKSISKAIRRSSVKDSIKLENISYGDFNVAVSLESALLRPGSAVDVVLQAGDKIIIPKYVNTVRVEGEVMFPTAVVHRKGASARDYINNAGGFAVDARRSRVFIVFPDGHAARRGCKNSRIEPGSVIIVPAKEKKDKRTASEMLATASTATSLVTMLATVASVVNSFVK